MFEFGSTKSLALPKTKLLVAKSTSFSILIKHLLSINSRISITNLSILDILHHNYWLIIKIIVKHTFFQLCLTLYLCEMKWNDLYWPLSTFLYWEAGKNSYFFLKGFPSQISHRFGPFVISLKEVINDIKKVIFSFGLFILTFRKGRNWFSDWWRMWVLKE